MSDIQTVLEALKGARDLAVYVEEDAQRVQGAHHAQQLQSLIEALRLIYFSPKGILSIIQKLADGECPTINQVEIILTNFNDSEDVVHRMIGRLEPPEGFHRSGLTLRANRTLGEIAYGKGGIRAKVQRLLNHALTYDEPISADAAASLRDEIVALNCAIEHAEEALLEAIR